MKLKTTSSPIRDQRKLYLRTSQIVPGIWGMGNGHKVIPDFTHIGGCIVPGDQIKFTKNTNKQLVITRMFNPWPDATPLTIKFRYILLLTF